MTTQALEIGRILQKKKPTKKKKPATVNSCTGHNGGCDGYAVHSSFHVNPGKDADYVSGRNSNDPQGYWGRPKHGEGDAYSGDENYGSGDGR